MRITTIRVAVALIVLLMVGDFIFRGIVPSQSSGKNDFSDPYVGAWLWRHGQNPWDSNLMSSTAERLSVSNSPVIPIYPLTTYVLVAPLSFLSWHWANLLWVLVSVVAACLIPWALLRIGDFDLRTEKAWLLVGLAIAFPPLHRAVHVGNAAVIAVALCFIGIYSAAEKNDLASGAMLAVATGLKPQIGLWILFFYLLRRRWLLVCSAAVGLAALTGAAVFRIAVPLPLILATYRSDLLYWFGPGGPNDFTAQNPLHFQLVNAQVIFWQLLHDRTLANVLAVVATLTGLSALGYAVAKKGMRSEPLIITALVGLSFVVTYHSVTDVTILLLVLCWALNDSSPGGRHVKGLALLSLLLLFLPVHSFLIRIEPYVGPSVIASWPWNLLVGPSYIWLVLFLNLVLLFAAAASPGPENQRNGW